jgi:hypothetical protein
MAPNKNVGPPVCSLQQKSTTRTMSAGLKCRRWIQGRAREQPSAMKATFIVQLLSILVLVTGCSFEEPDPRTRQTRSVCAAMGFRPNEAYFFTCVESLNMTAPKGSTELLANRGVAYVAPDDGGSDIHKRSERACYDVGLNPSQGSYWECVLDLDNSIADAAAVGSR